MQMLQEFFHMGGYAFYVWSAYGLSMIVLILNVILPMRNEKQIFRKLSKQAQRNRKNK